MIKYSEPIMRKRFSGESLQEAKEKALEWIGEYVICKDELKDVSYTVDVDTEQQSPTIAVTLFAHLEVSEVQDRHCKICKEFHKSFFVNENCNCNACNLVAFEKRMEDTLRSKKLFYKENLRRILSKG